MNMYLFSVCAILCLIFPVSYATTNQTSINQTTTERALVSPLQNANGIVPVVSKILDFPHAVWNIRLKLDWKTMFSYYTELDGILQRLKIYGADVSKVTLTEDITFRLGEAVGIAREVRDRFIKIRDLFKLSNLKKIVSKIFQKIVSRLPFIAWKDPPSTSNYVIDVAKQTVFVKPPIAFRAHFNEFAKQIPAQSTLSMDAKYAAVANWPQFVNKLVDRLMYLSDFLTDIQEIISMVIDGQLPPRLVPVDILSQVIGDIRKTYQFSLIDSVDTDVLRTYTIPMTFITHDVKLESGNDASSSYVHLFYFVTPVFNRFELSTVHTLPIPTSENHWRTYVPKQRNFISNSGQKWAVEKDAYNCIDDVTTDIVPICFFQEYPNIALDDCSLAIFSKKDIESHCPYKELKSNLGKVVSISPNSWAYSIEELSSVLEKCDNKPERTVMMMKTGVLDFHPDCKYHLTNGPFQGVLPFTWQNFYEIHSGKLLPQFPKNAHPVTEHFKIYGYIYILVIMSILFLLVTIAVIIYVRIRLHRTRHSHSVRYTGPSRLLPNDEDRQIGRDIARVMIQEFARPRPIPLRAV